MIAETMLFLGTWYFLNLETLSTMWVLDTSALR